ncbi:MULTISPECIES: thioredoxin family protein [Fischerella]|uniref:Thiol reductase thioredoxin n=1 Tax=Fischerella muscicola CCMEE 5323 TaxID=2019572 RepID=A0A2N6K4I5_FISMU|nr:MULTISPECIES: thioredoxin domain-containing protein [Fischerella]MBD2431713.1 thiol reductase thioredoxin [Fischerella sp. FACHB-380]PLZ91072.1 thiol reductase thioredoxin [Fischerella muscicola CCMEE 5323]
MAIKEQFNKFDELLSSSKFPLLVVFSAPWCGPSYLMDSILEQVNSQMKQQLQIVKIDSEKYPDLANQYQVHALPAMVLFRNGQPVELIEAERIEDLISAEHLIQRLQPLVQQQ